MRAWFAIAGVVALWVAGRLVALESDALRLSMDAVLAVLCLVASLRFERGDPPRWAWGLAAGAQILSTALHATQAGWLGAGAEAWSGPITLVLNAFWVGAIAMFVRNVWSSGLAPPWSRGHVAGVALAIAAALAGLGLVVSEEFATMREQGLTLSDEMANLASATADTLVFIGAVLLIRMVAPMAGGRVARPYLLLCFSAAAYLVVDVIVAAADTRVYAALDVGSQVWVALADGALAAAVVAQLDLLRNRD